VIPAQAVRDLLYREAAQEHAAKLVQLRIRPFPAGVRVRAMIVTELARAGPYALVAAGYR
jgi:hypothetical protein